MRPFHPHDTVDDHRVDVVANAAVVGLVGAQGLEPWTR
jgi:hypothetical protein